MKAALQQVKIQNFALAVDEMEDGTLSIAVPLSDRNGRIVAALSYASHSARSTSDALRSDILPVLCTAREKVQAIIADFQDRNWVVFSLR